MTDPLQTFFARARSLSLRSEERTSIQETLLGAVRGDDLERHRSRMDEREKAFFRNAQRICLLFREKNAVLASLQDFMRGNQVEEHHQENAPLGSALQEIGGFLLRPFTLRNFTLTLAGIVLLCTSTGLLAYAAEKALPGDFLYPVKTEFTEPFIGLLAFSPPARTAWNLRRLERRLEESESLLMHSAMTLTQHTILLARFEEDYQRVQKGFRRASTGDSAVDAAQGSDHLQNLLIEHEANVTHFRESLPEIQPYLERISTAKKSARAIRDEAEAKLAIPVRSSLIEDRKNQVERSLEQLQSLTDGEVPAETAKALTLIEKHLERVDAALEKGAVTEAESLLDRERERARAVRHILEARTKLKDLLPAVRDAPGRGASEREPLPAAPEKNPSH